MTNEEFKSLGDIVLKFNSSNFILVKFNINNFIRVKLTAYGRLIYKKSFESIGMEAAPLDEDEEGWSRWQMHRFMRLFGEHSGTTVPSVCDPVIEIEVKNEM